MKATINEVKALAVEFLALADALSENVSAYFDGSNKNEDVKAYNTVKDADRKFVDAVNAFYGANECEYGLNYELAESFIY